MAFTVANVTTVTKQVLSTLNASSAWAATSDDDKFVTAEVTEAVLEADEQVYLAICETSGHWARVEIMAASTDLTVQGQEIPSHIGDIGEVTITHVSGDSSNKLANPMDRKEIEIYQRDTDSILNAAHAASGTLVAGYYDPKALMDGIAYFTGYAMQVRIATYTRTALCQSPEVYASAIVAGALSTLFTKDGLETELAKYYSMEFDKRLAAIRRDAMSLPEIVQTQKAVSA